MIMLHIPEALRHTLMPGIQTGRTRKDIQQFVENFVSKICIMLHNPEALRRKVMPGLQPG